MGVYCPPYSSPIQGKYLLNNGLVTDVIVYENETLKSCIARCDMDTTYCMAFNFFHGNGTCILTSNLIEDEAMVELSGWEVYPKLFPVFLSRPLDRAKYTLTKAEGAAHCSDISTTIATLSDVRTANSLGYSKCMCGWVEDNDKAVVAMTVQKAACLGIGVHDCTFRPDNKYDVFCKNKDYHFP